MTSMRRVQLTSVDLNLVPMLAALLGERSVTRAAATVGLSQSAMSRALARLRRLLDDELLVRGGDGYELTPVAEELLLQLGEVVPRLHRMFLDREYDPAAATREFRMAGDDEALATFGAAVSAAVLAAAPGASLRFLPWHSRIARELVESRIDLLFHGTRLDHPITSRLLLSDETVCVVDRGHPLAGATSLTMEQYLGCDHLVIDVVDGTQPSIDAVLAAHGRVRRARLTLPHHSAAPAAVIGTDLVLSVPSRLLTETPELRVLRAPADVRDLPRFVSWHSRQDHNKGHRWLRETAIGAITGARPAVAGP